MWSSLFARILMPRPTPEACPEGQELRAEWESARQPTQETALERLDLYEERKFLARAALVAHRQFCSLCQGEDAAHMGQSGMPDQQDLGSDANNLSPDSRKAA